MGRKAREELYVFYVYVRACVRPSVRPTFEAHISITVQDRRMVTGPAMRIRPQWVEWSRDRWRHVTPRCQGRDPIIFEAALKLFNFHHWPTQLTQLIYTDFSVSYRDALDRLRVRLNSILFVKILCHRHQRAHGPRDREIQTDRREKKRFHTPQISCSLYAVGQHMFRSAVWGNTEWHNIKCSISFLFFPYRCGQLA